MCCRAVQSNIFFSRNKPDRPGMLPKSVQLLLQEFIHTQSPDMPWCIVIVMAAPFSDSLI